MDSNNMIMTKSKNNALRAQTIKTLGATLSGRKFAGNKRGMTQGATTTKRSAKPSPIDREHQSYAGKDRKSTIMNPDINDKRSVYTYNK
jgi:hypothetical protein